jgi:hypothetical protein
MPDEGWIKTLEDGRKVKFVYQELPEEDLHHNNICGSSDPRVG